MIWCRMSGFKKKKKKNSPRSNSEKYMAVLVSVVSVTKSGFQQLAFNESSTEK